MKSIENTTNTSFSLPVRLLLPEQTAESIRQGLHRKRWAGVLPSEAKLCQELGVSRGTLRTALRVLFKEGLLRPGGHGCQHVIVAGEKAEKKRGASEARGKIVRVIGPLPPFLLHGNIQIILQTLSETLGRADLLVEYEYLPKLWKLKHPEKLLEKLVAQPDSAGWILYRSSHAIQAWFHAAKLPAVVLGGLFPGIALPNAEFDLAAASHHAAGVFAARGHRRMAFLSIKDSTAGDYASMSAFQGAATAAGAYAQTVTFEDTIPHLCRALDRLFRSRAVPTAYFVAEPNHVFATIGHLARCGFPVPASAAVISRFEESILNESIPSVARYHMNAERLAKAAGRLFIKALNPAHKGFIEKCSVMPEFVDGETAGGPRTL